MSPTRRQLIAGALVASISAATPEAVRSAPAPVEPMRGVIVAHRGRQERNATIELHEDGSIVIGKPDEPNRTISFRPYDRFTPAEWVERLFSAWPQSK